VVDSLGGVVVPEFAFRAEVVGGVVVAVDADVGGGLRGGTEHAEHVLGFLSIQCVWEGEVVGLIVAVAAGKPTLAVEALDFDVAFVVHAS
jgi:hypothetical protein